MDLRNSDEPMRLSRTSNRRVSKLPVSSPKTAWYSVVDRLGFEGPVNWPPQASLSTCNGLRALRRRDDTLPVVVHFFARRVAPGTLGGAGCSGASMISV